MNMLKKLACALALCAALPCASLAADIAVVDVARVYAESKAAQEADAHVNKVRAVLQQGMADLEKNLDARKLSKKEREAELASGLRVLERQMQLEIQAARISLDVNTYLYYDMKTYDKFFASHRNEVLDNIGDAANDTYLKVSGEKEGTASYAQVSIYLVNWYLEEMVLPYEEDNSEFDPMNKDHVHGALGD